MCTAGRRERRQGKVADVTGGPARAPSRRAAGQSAMVGGSSPVQAVGSSALESAAAPLATVPAWGPNRGTDSSQRVEAQQVEGRGHRLMQGWSIGALHTGRASDRQQQQWPDKADRACQLPLVPCATRRTERLSKSGGRASGQGSSGGNAMRSQLGVRARAPGAWVRLMWDKQRRMEVFEKREAPQTSHLSAQLGCMRLGSREFALTESVCENTAAPQGLSCSKTVPLRSPNPSPRRTERATMQSCGCRGRPGWSSEAAGGGTVSVCVVKDRKEGQAPKVRTLPLPRVSIE